jgi:phosphoribosyl-AMP cyclohydrolase
MTPDELRYDEHGVVPAVIQDAESGAVLMVGYMSRESLEKTLEKGETVFWSRSRQVLWPKGATSGNTQRVREIRYDCDADALLVRVEQKVWRVTPGNTRAFTKPFTGHMASPLRNMPRLARPLPSLPVVSINATWNGPRDPTPQNS